MLLPATDVFSISTVRQGINCTKVSKEELLPYLFLAAYKASPSDHTCFDWYSNADMNVTYTLVLRPWFVRTQYDGSGSLYQGHAGVADPVFTSLSANAATGAINLSSAVNFFPNPAFHQAYRVEN